MVSLAQLSLKRRLFMNKLIKSISAVLVVALIISLLPTNAIRASAYTRGTIDNPTNDYPRYKLKPEKVGKPKKLVFKFDYDSFNLKFKDVPVDHPYRKEIAWAVKNGIFKNEAINFKPDEQMTMRELCQMGYELRWKYQQKPDKKIMERYNYVLSCGVLDYKTINPNIPEFRFIMARNFGFGILSSKTIDSRLNGDTYFANLYYKPDVKVNGLVFMSFLGGALDEGGICRGKLREIHKKSEDDWDRYLNVMFYLRNRNLYTYLKHLPKGYSVKNVISEKKIDEVDSTSSVADIADGILTLYLIDFWKDLPSNEEVEEFFGKKITKGEIVSIIYDAALVGYTKYDKKEGPVDLRISHYE